MWKDWLEQPIEKIDPNHLRRYIFLEVKPHKFANHQEYREVKQQLHKRLQEVEQFKTQQRQKKNKQEEKEYKVQLQNLITENLPFIKLQVRGHDIRIDPTTFEIVFTFYPCRHTLKMPIWNLLSDQGDDPTHKWQILFNRFTNVVKHIDSINGTRNCQQCIQQRRNSRIRREIPMGVAQWSLRHLR